MKIERVERLAKLFGYFVWFFIVSAITIFCLGFAKGAYAPLYETYESKEKIVDEFKNIENDLQSREFRVFSSTPNLSDLVDGEIVVFSSGSVKIMFRNLNDVYSVNASCITIRR